MDLLVSGLRDFGVVAKDGTAGIVADFLFDTATWKIRWLVVDTGSWLAHRQVLIHPSVIGEIDFHQKVFFVELPRCRIKASPPVRPYEPLSPETDGLLHRHYGSDPHWGNSYSGECWPPPPLMSSPLVGGTYVCNVAPRPRKTQTDPNLRSIESVSGRHIHAMDGEIGHVEDFIVNDASWDIHYLMVDTRNWWPGNHVLISPHAILPMQGSDHALRVDMSRRQVKDSPPWVPPSTIAGRSKARWDRPESARSSGA